MYCAEGQDLPVGLGPAALCGTWLQCCHHPKPCFATPRIRASLLTGLNQFLVQKYMANHRSIICIKLLTLFFLFPYPCVFCFCLSFLGILYSPFNTICLLFSSIATLLRRLICHLQHVVQEQFFREFLRRDLVPFNEMYFGQSTLFISVLVCLLVPHSRLVITIQRSCCRYKCLSLQYPSKCSVL